MNFDWTFQKNFQLTRMSAEIPECFQKDAKWSILFKYGSTVLIGKHKLVFPINIPLMREQSKYIQTLIDATNIQDFSKLTLLGDHDITYDNEAFMTLWGRLNLLGEIDQFGKNTWLKSALNIHARNIKRISDDHVWRDSRVKFLIDCRYYACYFGFSVNEIDIELMYAKSYRLKVPDELRDEFEQIIKNFNIKEFDDHCHYLIRTLTGFLVNIPGHYPF